MNKGDYLEKLITITVQSSGNPVDLTLSEVVFTVKRNGTDSNILIQKKNTAAGGGDDEIEMTDPTNGKCLLKVDEVDTEDLAAGAYIYDVEIVHSLYKTKTPIKDQFILIQDVTN